MSNELVYPITGGGWPVDVKKKFSRRSAVALLGLTAVASSADTAEAIGVETSERGFNGTKFGGNAKRDLIASALERLAADIRAGNTFVMGSNLSTSIDPEEFVTHKFAIEFAVRDLPEG